LSIKTSKDGFRVPVLLGFILFFGQLTSETHSLLFFFFFGVLFLVLFHLELHHLDAPLSIRKIRSEIRLMIVDILRVRSLELIHAAICATDQHVG